MQSLQHLVVMHLVSGHNIEISLPLVLLLKKGRSFIVLLLAHISKRAKVKDAVLKVAVIIVIISYVYQYISGEYYQHTEIQLIKGSNKI